MLIPRPKYKESHEKVIAKANEKIEGMGKNSRAGVAFQLHSYFKQHKGDLFEMFWRDNIHQNKAAIELLTSCIVRHAWAIVRANPALQQQGHTVGNIHCFLFNFKRMIRLPFCTCRDNRAASACTKP